MISNFFGHTLTYNFQEYSHRHAKLTKIWKYLQTKIDITNQTLSNIIRQLSCLASFAEEILGDAGNALANQNARIYNLSNRIEQLDAKVQILNPKQIGMWFQKWYYTQNSGVVEKKNVKMGEIRLHYNFKLVHVTVQVWTF